MFGKCLFRIDVSVCFPWWRLFAWPVWQKGRVFYRWAFAGRSLVVSNNQDYEAGQSFTLTSGSGSAYVKIQAVKDGKLMLENRGNNGVITMKKS
jgi:hypothetical protein